jgi:hypothetical protein
MHGTLSLDTSDLLGKNVLYIKNPEKHTTIAEEVVCTTMPLQIAASTIAQVWRCFKRCTLCWMLYNFALCGALLI